MHGPELRRERSDAKRRKRRDGLSRLRGDPGKGHELPRTRHDNRQLHRRPLRLSQCRPAMADRVQDEQPTTSIREYVVKHPELFGSRDSAV
jgi:hypothetical protein